MSARDEVLARIRDAVGASRGAAHIERGYRRSGALPAGAQPLLDLFVDRLVDYKATVTRTDEAGLPGAISAALRSAATCVVPGGVPTGWTSGWDGEVLVDDRAAPLDLATLDAATVLTGSRVAIAETGTIVLDAGPDQGRRALTLVPDHHVCVVRSEQVVASVPDAVAVLDAVRPLTWISGPSATSDIELHRVEGVHGPRRLDVVLLTPP